MSTDLPALPVAATQPRPVLPDAARALKGLALASGGVVVAALGLTLVLVAVVFGWGDNRVSDKELAEPRAHAELGEQLQRAFGVAPPNAARLVRARLRRGVSQSAEWFLVQLPPGGGAAFEARLRAVARDKERGWVEFRADRPGGGDRDDWAEFPPLDARIWRTDDERHEVMLLGDRFYFVSVFL